MKKRIDAITILKILGVIIGLIQLFDIAIHAATDQLEFLRVSSNVIILLWLAISASGRLNVKSLLTAVSAVGSYLIPNGIFLAREGWTNPEQGGELRIMLLLLVFLTVASSGVLAYLQSRRV